MITTHPYQADPNRKNSRMIWRACVQLQIYENDIDASINTQMLKTPHDLLVQLAALDNVRSTVIGTLKKENGYIFSEWYTESFKEKIPWYVN